MKRLSFKWWSSPIYHPVCSHYHLVRVHLDNSNIKENGHHGEEFPLYNNLIDESARFNMSWIYTGSIIKPETLSDNGFGSVKFRSCRNHFELICRLFSARFGISDDDCDVSFIWFLFSALILFLSLSNSFFLFCFVFELFHASLWQSSCIWRLYLVTVSGAINFLFSSRVRPTPNYVLEFLMHIVVSWWGKEGGRNKFSSGKE